MSTYKLWIKEKQVAQLTSYTGFAFAYSLRGPNEGREVCEKEARPAPALNGMVRLLAEIVGLLPPGAHLVIVADFDALVGAFDARDYLAKWRGERFRGRPQWAALDAVLQERRVTISAVLGKAADPIDRQSLQGLSELIGLHWPRAEPKSRKKNYRERGPSDGALRRALEKSEDFPKRRARRDPTGEDDDGDDGSD